MTYDYDTHVQLHRIWCASLHAQVDADFDEASTTREAIAFGDLRAYVPDDVPLNPNLVDVVSTTDWTGKASFSERLAKAVWD